MVGDITINHPGGHTLASFILSLLLEVWGHPRVIVLFDVFMVGSEVYFAAKLGRAGGGMFNLVSIQQDIHRSLSEQKSTLNNEQD